MYQRKIMRLLAGVLCGIMLFTGEGMSSLVYAASIPQAVADEVTGGEDASGTEMPAEIGAAAETPDGESKEIPEGTPTDETKEETGDSSTEAEDSEGNPAENPEGDLPENPEGNPPENPEGDPAENPEGDLPENPNDNPAEEEAPEKEMIFEVKGGGGRRKSGSGGF